VPWKPEESAADSLSPFAADVRESRGPGSAQYLELPWAETDGEFGDESWTESESFEEPRSGGSGSTAVVPPAATPTIGFEFDLSVGINHDVFTARAADMPAGTTFPPQHVALSDHVGRDASQKVVDGFKLQRDGPRIEIATVPIGIHDDASFNAVVKNVVGFAKELEKARSKVKPDRTISVTDISGHPIRFTHPRTLISKLPLVIAARGPSDSLRWPTDVEVWAAPQATITIGLHRVGDLIDAISASAGKGRGKALTGSSSQRLGVRSDIVVVAKRRVLADRTRRLGTKLSDGSAVSKADYSDRLAGLLMLMTSYMLCGEMLDKRDYELFAKGYLPINVKAPFWQLFKSALSDRERVVFKELYVNSPANFYALAKDGAKADDGKTELFPPKVRGPDLDRFHVTRLTWKTLLDNTVSGTPLKVTKDNTVQKKNHKRGDEILFAPLSSIIPFDTTKPCVALELRRIGFAVHPVRFFAPLMNTVRALTKKLTS
jgi:hypothetical protein